MFETAVYRPPLARRWRRLAAAALDLLLILPCVGLFLLGVILNLSAHFDHAYRAGPLAVPEATLNLPGVGVALTTGVLLLQAGTMYLSGQTVGKKLLQIRVVKAE